MAQAVPCERIATLRAVQAAPNSQDEFGTLVRSELQARTRFDKASGIKAN
jgi:hypothetical protein